MIAPETRWHCPPARHPATPEGVWCDGLPCRGHASRKLQRQAARVLAWADGWDVIPSEVVGDYLQSAHEALHATALGGQR